MAENAALYDAGYSVSVDAEQHLEASVDKEQFDVEILQIGEDRFQLGESVWANVELLSAFVIDGAVHRIDRGADLAALGQASGDEA